MRSIGAGILILAIALVALIAPGGAMHDKHGNEIQVGDIVSGPGPHHAIVGPVSQVYPGSEMCNALVLQAHQADAYPHTVTITANEFEVVFTGHGRLLEHGPYAGYRSEGEYRRARAHGTNEAIRTNPDGLTPV